VRKKKTRCRDQNMWLFHFQKRNINPGLNVHLREGGIALAMGKNTSFRGTEARSKEVKRAASTSRGQGPDPEVNFKKAKEEGGIPSVGN